MGLLVAHEAPTVLQLQDSLRLLYKFGRFAVVFNWYLFLGSDSCGRRLQFFFLVACPTN